MYGVGSRRIEGRGNIQRPGDSEYINTTHLPPQKTIQAVRYYNRRKEELKMNVSADTNPNPAGRNPGAATLKNQIQNVIKSNKLVDPHVTNHIKEVKIEPIITDNNSNAFDEAKYPLNEEERVNVVEERYFPLKSYYIYIYETQLKKQMNRFVNETEAKVMEVVHDQMGEKPRTEQDDLIKEKSQHYLDEIPVKDNNQNRPSSKVGKSILAVNELVPFHIDYTGKNSQQSLVFTVNENKRLEMSRRK